MICIIRGRAKSYKSCQLMSRLFQQHLFFQVSTKVSTRDTLDDMAHSTVSERLEWLLVVELAMASDATSLLAKCQACFLSRFLKMIQSDVVK